MTLARAFHRGECDRREKVRRLLFCWSELGNGLISSKKAKGERR